MKFLRRPRSAYAAEGAEPLNDSLKGNRAFQQRLDEFLRKRGLKHGWKRGKK